MLHTAPVVKATQERFKIFQKSIESNLKNDIKIASIPCGVMDDLLYLHYDKFWNIELFGIDIDDQSLVLAKENLKQIISRK